MKAHRVNAEGLRVFDPKVSPNNPTSSEEVILGDISPPNVISFQAYVAKRNLELALNIRPRIQRSQWEKQHISRLYRLLVLPYFPKRRLTLDHFHLFLHYTLPFIVRNTVFEGASAVCNAFYHRNKAFLLKARIPYPTFKKRCMAVIANSDVPEIPEHPHITKPLHREALRIMWALSNYDGQGNAAKGMFFLSAADLQARLFTRHKKTAQRLLERFCEIGVLEAAKPGIDRRKAKELAVKPRAATFWMRHGK